MRQADSCLHLQSTVRRVSFAEQAILGIPIAARRWKATVYLDLVMLLNFLVDGLLLLGANRLCGYPPGILRCTLAAGLGGLYSGACVLPGFSFLGSFAWRLVSLVLMSVIAYGMSISALRRGTIFLLLSMALGGIALGLGSGGFTGLVASAGMLCLLCALGFRGALGGTRYVPVELCHAGKRLKLTAMHDTGNTLRDPVSGLPVLVVGPDTAEALTGLTPQQLRQPLETVGAVPGLRLIPYRAVGKESGFLLGLRVRQVQVGNWKGSRIVAFAPDRLSAEGAYQALTGGIL